MLRAVCRTARPLLLLTLPLASLAAQGKGKEERIPPRPRFTVPRDSNSAPAYYYHGMQMLGRKPREAADAFWWASRLDPQWADPLYARRVALHLAEPDRLADYILKDRRTAEQERADSLQQRALLIDPFLYRKLDKFLVEQALDAAIARARRESGEGGGGMPVRLRPRDIAFESPRTAGWLAYADGQFADALRYYAAAIKRSPKAYDIHSDRADVLYLVGQYDSTLAALGTMLDEMRKVDQKKLLPFYDSKAFVEYQIGRVHVARGDLAQAREAYGRALTEDLSFYMAHAALSDVALALHDTATALAEYDLAVQIRGDDAGLRYGYGAALFGAAKYAAAAAQFRRAVELDPDYAKPYYPLAYMSDGMGNDAEAQQFYEAYVLRAPASDGQRVADARTRLAELRAAKAASPATTAPATAAPAPAVPSPVRP